MLRQTKLINLSRITQYLTLDGVPNLLSHNFDPKWIDSNIKLRLFPLSLPILPTLSGQLQYQTCLNTLRLFSNRFLLDKKIKNDINIPHKLNIISIDTIKNNQSTIPTPRNKLFSTTNDKLIIKWQTSPSHYTNINSKNYIRVQDGMFTENKNDRMIMGNFILELNQDNSRILVHTIENIEFYHIGKKENNEKSTNVSMC